ncbi:glycosyltransferase family 2 protein, partial [bacterium]|nr:glycosyltransferase family 2 protein [bacterium]
VWETDTIEAVRSVQKMIGANFRILVVDNGSRPESRKAIRDALPDVELENTGENLGYAGGNNVALRRAIKEGYAYALILNNDLTVEPDLLERLLQQAEADPKLALLGPRVYRHDKPDELFYSGWKIHWRKWLFLRVPPDASRAPVVDVDFVQGCSLLARSDFLREEGPFDERFHLYCEDAELAVRAQKAGWRTVEVPAAHVYHKGYGSSGKDSPLKTYYGLRNRLLFISKHAPLNNRMRLKFQLVAVETGTKTLRTLPRLLTAERSLAWRTLRALARALYDAAQKRYGKGPAWLFKA